MLNRRILRVKAFKAIYSYAENPAMTLKEAEILLEESCESTRDLYLFLLSIVSPLTAQFAERIESARQKFNPTQEERNPNFKFVQNALAPILDADPDFTKIIKRKKFSWEQYDVLLRHLYDTIRTRDYFIAYMDDPERSLKKDAALFCDIFANELVDNPELEDILEDMSILWNDDLTYAVNVCIKTLTDLGNGHVWKLPELFKTQPQSDKAFVVGLLRSAYNGFARYYEMVSSNTPKWDKNRICMTDLALIVCGLGESEAFSQTPVSVIINEYVEISKFYSTPESRGFVNGLLDKLINNK